MRGSITIETMWAHIIVFNIRKFFYFLIERLLYLKFMKVCTLVFQSVEITLHRGIVVWISCLAHALRHMN